MSAGGTVADWLRKAEDFLAHREVPEARASAEFLLAETLGTGRAGALARPERQLTAKESHQFWAWTKERGKRLPLAYVLGHQPFFGLKIEVNRDSLVPRPETEELVLECERLVETLGAPAPTILEIGTGTGCVAVALAQLLPRATVFATDVSEKALRLAQRNAIAHHVANRIRFVREDLFSGKQGLRGWADLLVSNPPYIPSAELDRLEPEVRAEPRLALDGGRDGLDALRAIAAAAPKLLKPEGYVALEIGAKQGAAAARLLQGVGLADVSVKKDLQGFDRIVVGRLPRFIVGRP